MTDPDLRPKIQVLIHRQCASVASIGKPLWIGLGRDRTAVDRGC